MNIFTGVVENRQDPLKLGRCQVRVVGLHTHDKSLIPTEDLPWSYPLQPIISAGMSGIGHSPLGPVEGSWVIVMFRDPDKQQPILLGTLGGIPQDEEPIDSDNNQMILKKDGYFPPAEEQTFTDKNGNVISNTSESLEEEDTGLKSARDYTSSQVVKNNLMTDNMYDADKLAEVEAIIQETIKTDITQGMYDALVTFTYHNGEDTLKSSNILKDLNNNDYVGAATGFIEQAIIKETIDPLEVKKRIEEKNLFIEGGVPDQNGNLVPIKSILPPIDSTSTATGQADTGLKMTLGFKDPYGKYPLYKFEPDTNKLARHEDIKKTIVRKKELTRTKDVVTAFNVTWTQSPIPYNAAYPYNHVYQSESGHVLEFDDTKNSERVHLYHTKGTFFEIDANGTKVEKIVGDNYQVMERDNHLYIKGSGDVTIDGHFNIKVNNNANIQVMGDATTHVHGNMETSVRGTYKLKASAINLESHSGNIHMLAADKIAGDAVRVDFNSGVATSSGLNTPAAYSITMPSFKELQVITRGVEAAAHYETPEEGDPEAYIAKRIAEGTLDPDEQDSGTLSTECSVGRNSAVALPQSCTLINAMDKFTPDIYLSKHFTLSALTKNGTRMPVNQKGLTAQQIVCNLKGLCENVLEPIAERYPGMIITSGFRRPGDVRGSSNTSQHYNGEAADIVIPGYSREQHFKAACEIAKVVPFDQILLEYSGKNTVWIHVSYKYSANRYQGFTMRDHKRVSSNGTFVLIT